LLVGFGTYTGPGESVSPAVRAFLFSVPIEYCAEDTFADGTIGPNWVLEPLFGALRTCFIGTVPGRGIVVTVCC